MRADTLILGGWTLLVAIEAVVALFFETLPALLLAWATLAGAALFAYVRLRRPVPEEAGEGSTRFVPDLSPQTVLLAIGIASLVDVAVRGQLAGARGRRLRRGRRLEPAPERKVTGVLAHAGLPPEAPTLFRMLTSGLLALAGLLGAAFVVYVVEPDTQLLGIAFGLALAALAVAMVRAANAVVPREVAVQPRPDVTDAGEDRETEEAFRAGVEGVSRRKLLLGASTLAAGCAVNLFRYPKHEPTSDPPALVCPCHFSTFDVREAARVVFGPAARALPQLPLRIDGGGRLVAAGGFSDAIGPSWWGVRRT